MPWIVMTPYTCAVKFEDLIGEKGGGSLPRQQETIIRIAQYLGYKLSQADLQTIIDNLFGGTYSFREGKIGEWKHYFNDQHKTAFKKIAGQLLIDLGYENDFNW
jgi:sulfotransferase 6B1